MIANMITVSRIVFSLLLLVPSLPSCLFTALYLLCGITDILDGFAARKLHTESKTGETLDSVADLIFTGICAVRILPLLTVPLWIWIWAAAIAVTKLTGIMIASKKAHRITVEHSLGNRLTGILLFLLPLTVYWTNVKYSATIVCCAATGTAIKEIHRIGEIKNAV